MLRFLQKKEDYGASLEEEEATRNIATTVYSGTSPPDGNFPQRLIGYTAASDTVCSMLLGWGHNFTFLIDHFLDLLFLLSYDNSS